MATGGMTSSIKYIIDRECNFLILANAKDYVHFLTQISERLCTHTLVNREPRYSISINNGKIHNVDVRNKYK